MAESVGKTTRTIERQAAAHQWKERVAAWDDEQARQHRAKISRKALKLAQGQMDVALGMVNAVARSVKYVLDNGITLEPADAARWVDVASKVAKIATSQPDITVGVTGGDGGPIEISIPELDGLPPDQARQRLSEMVASVARLADYQTGGTTAA